MTMLFQTIVSKDAKIREVIKVISESESRRYIPGIAAVNDHDNTFLGIITDGDIRRGICQGAELDDSIEKVINKTPLTTELSTPAQMRNEYLRKVKNKKEDIKKYDKVVITKDNKLHDIIWWNSLLEEKVEEKSVAVYGMGFVGLTLTAILANHGFIVSGVDTNQKVINQLKDCSPHFFENGLQSMLKSIKTRNPIEFTTTNNNIEADVHIISVGTPVLPDNSLDMSSINAVTRSIANKLKHNDLIIYRSTVPVGTIRNSMIPILEESGLKAGEDFHVAFAPERTVEGDALRELEQLPQIVGGINHKSTDLAYSFFKTISPVVVEVDSLEAAEMVKLMNNTFRDLIFSFANEVSIICEKLNINAFKLINAANEGYPRDTIPRPSPGVGGMCLTKDPFIYSNPLTKIDYSPKIGKMSREINTSMFDIIINKLDKYSRHINKPLAELKIFFIGLAFKGRPETSDIRGSSTIEIINRLPNPSNIYIKDFVIDDEKIYNALECHMVENVLDGFENADIVMVMNNHYQNNKFDISKAVSKASNKLLFFDSWHMFSQEELEKYPNVVYSTLGYMDI